MTEREAWWLITSTNEKVHYFADFEDAYKQWSKDGRLFSVKRPVRMAGLKWRWIRLHVEEIERIHTTSAN